MSQSPSQPVPLPPSPLPAPPAILPYANPAGQFVPNGDQAARAIKLVKAVILTEVLLLLPLGVVGTWFFAGEAQSWNDIGIGQIAFIVISGIVGLAYGILYVLSAVFFLMWLYRACRNVRALGAGDLRISPAWAIGWWFIPIANLLMPYRACKELCLASLRLTTPTLSKRPPWLALWWACWICNGITSLLAQHATDFSNALPYRIAATLLHLTAIALTVIAGLLCIRLIRTIESTQLAATTSPAA